MKIINKNILDIDDGIICHQVNNMGKMGAGLALDIRKKYPAVYDKYISTTLSLGDCQIIEIKDSLYVANLVGQINYGRNKQYTNVYGLAAAIKQAYMFAQKSQLNIYFPYKIGCGLGGGNWDEIQDIIKALAPESIVCKR